MALTERDISREIDRMALDGGGGFGSNRSSRKREILRDKLETRLDRATSEERGFFGIRETVTEEELNNVVEDLKGLNDFTDSDVNEVKDRLSRRLDNSGGGIF